MPIDTAKTGYAIGAKTYGKVRREMPIKMRLLGHLGDFLDRFLRTSGAPLFPKDAPLHQPNCGVVAMCMLADRPYADVVAIFARSRPTSWIGGTHRHEYEPCATELGLSVAANFSPKRQTLADLARSTEGKPGRIFATVHGHAVCLWDGLIFDQNYPAGATPDEHFSARDRVVYTLTRA